MGVGGARVYGEEVGWTILQMRNREVQRGELTQLRSDNLFLSPTQKYLDDVTPPSNHPQQAGRCWHHQILYYQILNCLQTLSFLPTFQQIGFIFPPNSLQYLESLAHNDHYYWWAKTFPLWFFFFFFDSKGSTTVMLSEGVLSMDRNIFVMKVKMRP